MSFPARYEGQCSECGERIHIGDLIVASSKPAADDFRDVEYVHETCPEILTFDFERADVCGACFTVRAVNGACACP